MVRARVRVIVWAMVEGELGCVVRVIWGETIMTDGEKGDGFYMIEVSGES